MAAVTRVPAAVVVAVAAGAEQLALVAEPAAAAGVVELFSSTQ